MKYPERTTPILKIITCQCGHHQIDHIDGPWWYSITKFFGPMHISSGPCKICLCPEFQKEKYNGGIVD